MIKTKNQMFIVIGAFALVMLLGSVTYAFFNYTRTGTANTIQVGRIAFATNQTDTIALTNAFPITRTMAASDTTNTDDVVITISGDTDYSGGVEYLVTATGVTNTVGGKTLPISIIVTPSGTLGTESSTYYTARNSATSHIYKIEASNTITNNGRLMVGYIAPNTTQGTASGINGTLTIRAFIDSDLAAISDTTPEEQEDTNNDGYLNGTTTNWVNGRTVFTTEEWNSLQSEGISFKVKVEANEGIWVPVPQVTITYNANGGTVDPTSKQIAENSTTYGQLAIPTRDDGYTFDGWYTDSTNGIKVEDSTTYTHETSVTTLYAHWKKSFEGCPGPDCYYVYVDTNPWYSSWNTVFITPTNRY